MLHSEQTTTRFVERNQTILMMLCILSGIALGQYFPGLFRALEIIEIAYINLPLGLLIWVMMLPLLVKIDFAAFHQVRSHMKGIGVTIFISWLLKPFSMALLSWFFIQEVFYKWLPTKQLDSYIVGLILLASTPCTVRVYAWYHRVKGDPYFTLFQVSLNHITMFITLPPLLTLLFGVSHITIPWDIITTSVIFYIIIPTTLAQGLRKLALSQGKDKLETLSNHLQTWGVIAMLLTMLLLFAYQGEAILSEPLVLLLLTIPMLLLVLLNAGLTFWLNCCVGENLSVAGPSTLICSSSSFELALAIAISLFGIQSGAALATVVGILIEIPTMLFLVHVINKTKRWYEQYL